MGESPETIVREIEKAAQRAGITGRYEICFREAPSEGSRGFMPYTVPQGDSMTAALLDSIRQVTGKEPSISYFSSIGDFNYLGTRLGAPAIIFGADGENYHSSDEYVELSSVHQTAEAVLAFLEKVLLP